MTDRSTAFSASAEASARSADTVASRSCPLASPRRAAPTTASMAARHRDAHRYSAPWYSMATPRSMKPTGSACALQPTHSAGAAAGKGRSGKRVT